MDALLAHAGFVRGLARALLCDAAIADDVAQEAMLAAIQRPEPLRGQRPGGLRAWLAGVVKNLARQSRRGDARRQRRETSVAGRDPAPAASEAAARLDLIEHLVAAVRTLDEPYRTVVLARFFEGRTPHEIALEQGVPFETVRTRLKRAIERLRGVLGHEADWSALLLPLAGLPPGVVAGAGLPTAAASSAIGAIVMMAKTKFFIAAALVLALATSALVWRQTVKANSRPIADARNAESAARVAALPRPVPASQTVPNRAVDGDTEASNQDPRATFVVRGRVRSGTTKHPSPDAAVRAQLWRGYEMTGTPSLDVLLHSDDQGTFAWRLEPLEGPVWIRVRSETPHCRQQSVERLIVDGEKAPDDLDLTLYPIDRTVIGHVLDAAGQPVANARVAAFDPPAVDCDATGAYAIEMASSLSHQTLAAWAPGFAESRVEVQLDPSNGEGHVGVEVTVRQDFRLDAGATLEGSVTDSDGAAIEGAVVEEFRLRHFKATTAADGKYRLENLSVGIEQVVDARSSGHLLASKVLTLEPGESHHDFVLEKGVRVSGKVLLPDGRPARGAALDLGFSRFAYDRLDAIARDAGEFTFACVPRGELRLMCERPGFAPLETRLQVPADVASVDNVVLRLAASHFLEGFVVDEEGDPVEGALVRLLIGEEDFGGDRRSGGDGHFRVEGLPDAPLEACIDRAGYVRTRGKSIKVDHDDVQFILRRTGRAAGRVVDGSTGAPIARFRIRFVGPVNPAGSIAEYSWWNAGREFHSDDGAWDTGDEQIEPGTRFGIEASAEGYAPTLMNDVEFTVAPDRDDRILKLFRGASVDGVVVDDRDRHPVAGATVKVVNDATPMMLDGRPTTTPRPTTKTDGNGHFHLDSLPRGASKLFVDHADYTSTTSESFEVPASGAAPPQEVQLHRGAGIEAVVLDGHGKPRANARMMLNRLSGTGEREERSATTDAQGRFRIARLPAGRWQICVTEPSNGEWPQPVARFVELAPGEVQSFTMPPGSAIVTGHLTSDGKLPSPIIVEASRFGPDVDTESVFSVNGKIVRGRTRAPQLIDKVQVFVSTGAYELAGLSPGAWTITARAYDREHGVSWAARSEITISDGVTSTLDLHVTASAK